MKKCSKFFAGKIEYDISCLTYLTFVTRRFLRLNVSKFDEGFNQSRLYQHFVKPNEFTYGKR